MRDRTLGVILTLIVVFLIGVPGLACMCFGLLGFISYPFINSQTGITPAWINTAGAAALCLGFFLVLIAVVISYLLLHRRAETPAMVPVQPTPPPVSSPPAPPPANDQPAPPSNPDEPIPPPM